MMYIGLTILALTGIQLLIALLNSLFRTDYSRYRYRGDELVSIIIPARNEAKNIGNIVNDLLNQDYPNIEIIVVDDESQDNTGEKVIEISGSDSRVHLIRAGLHDNKWLGKNHACFVGANNTEGKYLLFVDADVRLGNEVISHLLGYFKRSKVSFLSVFPRQNMPENELYKVIPLMNYILLSLLPLFLVRHSKFVSLAAANGQFMLFDAVTYRLHEPHKKFRHEKVEDIHIARYLKKGNNKIACLTGNEDLSCTMYESYEDAMNGFSKNVVAFFGNSFLAAWAFWFISIAGFFLVGMTLPMYFLIIYFILVILTRVLIAITSRQDIMQNVQQHYIQLLNLGLLIYKSWQNKKNKSYQWKGRNIS